MYKRLVKATNIKNCGEELLGRNVWLTSRYATWANPENTFVKAHLPLFIDHIFWRVNSPKTVKVWTTAYNVPMLKTPCRKKFNKIREVPNEPGKFSIANCPSIPELIPLLNVSHCFQKGFSSLDSRRNRLNCGSQPISLSDHEPIVASINIKKQGK